MEKNRNTILAFYGILSVIVILGSLPGFRFLNMGMTLALIVLIVAYIARSRLPRNESFEENHTTYIIRTLWIYTSFAALCMVGASMEIARLGNLQAIQSVVDSAMSGVTPDEATMQASVNQYLADNDTLMKTQFAVWLCPAQLYLIWRIMKGGGRAFKSYRIANPKSWF